MITQLRRIDRTPTHGEDGDRQVGTCLEAVLSLARARPGLPTVLRLERSDVDGGGFLDLSIGPHRLGVSASEPAEPDETMRALSTPAAGASEVPFQVSTPDAPHEPVLSFSLPIRTRWLDGFTECWPTDKYWETSAALDPAFREEWEGLRQCVGDLRATIDPEWRNRDVADDAGEDNNALYGIFDLIYLAQRERFEVFLKRLAEGCNASLARGRGPKPGRLARGNRGAAADRPGVGSQPPAGGPAIPSSTPRLASRGVLSDRRVAR